VVLNSTGADVLAGAGKTGLRYDTTSNQFIYNWQTKGLAAGSYEILLKLANGTTQTKTIQVTASGSSACLPQKPRPYRDNPLRPRSRTNGAEISLPSGDAGMASGV